MPDYLALDYESRQISGFDASLSKGSVRLKSSFTLPVPTDEQLAADEPAAADDSGRMKPKDRIRLLGAWLKRELTSRTISTRQVLICVPREETVVRQLEVPDVPDRELADIVRLQAETRISSSLDKLLLDYIPLPSADEKSTRDVLMATITRDFAESITEALKAASCEPEAMGLSSFAMTELVVRVEQQRGLPEDEPSLVLARHGGRLELSLVCNQRLLFTHAAQLHGETDASTVRAILAEVSRSFMAMQQVLAGRKIARGWVIGTADDNEPLCQQLAERISCEVHPLEPLSELGLALEQPDAEANAARFAGPLGMLLAKAGRSTTQLDFLKPRRSARRFDPKKLRTGLMAGAGAVVVLLVFFGSWLYQRSLDTTRQELNVELQQLKSKVYRGRPTLESAGEINRWMQADNNLLDEMNELNDAFPGTDRIYFTEFRFRGLSGGNDQRLRIEAVGYAVDRRDVEILKQQLADRNYNVLPKPEKQDTKDPDYPYRFELELEVEAEPARSVATPVQSS